MMHLLPPDGDLGPKGYLGLLGCCIMAVVIVLIVAMCGLIIRGSVGFWFR